MLSYRAFVILWIATFLLVETTQGSHNSEGGGGGGGETTSTSTRVELHRIIDKLEAKKEQNNKNKKTTQEDVRAKEAWPNIRNHNTPIIQTEKDDNSIFTPAKSIDFFKHKIDPTLFEWFNKNQVKAGSTTCGYLYPPLGDDDTNNDNNDAKFPTIRVKFCMKFAEQQPASRGNLVVHCGGPGSLSSCFLGNYMGMDNVRNYNIITFDQRGLGMSWPSFAHEECTYGVERDELSGEITALIGESAFDVDPTNEQSILEFLDRQKQRVASCWSCQDCDFLLESPIDAKKQYHFLEYSGTRMVAHDLNTFRQAIGADKLSVYGVSYGTQVMATYASMFPQYTDKFAIDSNMPSHNTFLEFSLDIAKNTHKRLAYQAFTCSIRNEINPGTCPIDLNDCSQVMYRYFRQVFSSKGDLATFEDFYVSSLANEPYILESFQDACNAAKEEKELDFLSSLVKVDGRFLEPPLKTCIPAIFDKSVELMEEQEDKGTPNGSISAGLAAYYLVTFIDDETCQKFIEMEEQPGLQHDMVNDIWDQLFQQQQTFRKNRHQGLRHLSDTNVTFFANCAGPTYLGSFLGSNSLQVGCIGDSMEALDVQPYSTLMESPAHIPQTLVLAQSLSGSPYDAQHVVRQVQTVYHDYGGSYLGEQAAGSFLFWYSMGYHWPKEPAVSPMGAATIKGLISGQLYDYVTAYSFTQDMRAAFPSATLVTSQWTQHGFLSAKQGDTAFPTKKQATATTTNSSSTGKLMFQHGSSFDRLGGHTTSLWPFGRKHRQDYCQPIINNYFSAGSVQVNDGHVCSSPLPNTFQDFD